MKKNKIIDLTGDSGRSVPPLRKKRKKSRFFLDFPVFGGLRPLPGQPDVGLLPDFGYGKLSGPPDFVYRELSGLPDFFDPELPGPALPGFFSPPLQKQFLALLEAKNHDTLYTVARRERIKRMHDVSAENLLQENAERYPGLTKQSRLKPGTILVCTYACSLNYARLPE